MSIRTVITRFGGIRPMAEKLHHRSHTTVQGWWDRDVIPAQRQREVLNSAQRLGIELAADDLVGIAPPVPAKARLMADRSEQAFSANLARFRRYWASRGEALPASQDTRRDRFAGTFSVRVLQILEEIRDEQVRGAGLPERVDDRTDKIRPCEKCRLVERRRWWIVGPFSPCFSGQV